MPAGKAGTRSTALYVHLAGGYEWHRLPASWVRVAGKHMAEPLTLTALHPTHDETRHARLGLEGGKTVRKQETAACMHELLEDHTAVASVLAVDAH